MYDRTYYEGLRPHVGSARLVDEARDALAEHERQLGPAAVGPLELCLEAAAIHVDQQAQRRHAGAQIIREFKRFCSAVFAHGDQVGIRRPHGDVRLACQQLHQALDAECEAHRRGLAAAQLGHQAVGQSQPERQCVQVKTRLGTVSVDGNQRGQVHLRRDLRRVHTLAQGGQRQWLIQCLEHQRFLVRRKVKAVDL